MFLEYSFDVPSQEDKANFKMTMELFDFGTQVDVTPPPAGQVADFRELARKLAELQAAQGGQGGQARGAGQAPGTN